MRLTKRALYALLPSLVFLTFKSKGGGGGGGGDSVTTQKLDPEIKEKMLFPMYGASERAAGVTPEYDLGGKFTGYAFDEYTPYLNQFGRPGRRLAGASPYHAAGRNNVNQALRAGDVQFEQAAQAAAGLTDYQPQTVGGRDIYAQGIDSPNIYAQNVGSRDIASRDIMNRDIMNRDIASRDIMNQDIASRDIFARGTAREDIMSRDIMSRDIASRDIMNQDINAASLGRNSIRDVNNAGVTGAQVAADAFGSLAPQARASIRDVAGQGFMGGNLAQYLNPYTDNVIDTTLQDLNRQRQIQQELNAANAVNAGAFGGSRQGVVEAETNRGFADQASQIAAQLRDRGFTTAANLQQADADRALQAQLANQGVDLSTTQQALNLSGQFGLANQDANLRSQLANQDVDLNVGQLNTGYEQQANVQNAANNLTAQQINQASELQASLANQASALQTSLANQSTDFAAQQSNQSAALERALALSATDFAAQQSNQSSALQALLANQSTDFATQQSNQSAALDAGRANQASALQALLANQSTDFATQQSNQGSALQAAGANQDAALNAALANQSTDFATQQSNQDAGLRAALANQSTDFATQQSNQDASLRAALANQEAGFQGAQFNLGAAGQLAGLADQATNRELGDIELNFAMGDFGAMKLQEQLDLQYQDFLDEENYPAQQAAMLQRAFGLVPQVTSSTRRVDNKPDLWQNLADTFSDVRLKDNITKLNGYSYNFKSRPGEQTGGVMAQEVELIAPHLVNTDIQTGYKRVNYEALVGVLLEAVKDLQASVEELQRG